MSDGGASGGPSKFGLVADYRDDDSDGHSGTPGSRGPAVVIRSPPRPSQLPFSDALRCTASPLAGALPPVVTSVAEEPPRPYPATADAMADEDSSLAAAPAPLNLASLPAPLTAAAALPAAAPRAYPRLATLPPEPDEDPPPAVMEKMRQFWAATSKARAYLAWLCPHREGTPPPAPLPPPLASCSCAVRQLYVAPPAAQGVQQPIHPRPRHRDVRDRPVRCAGDRNRLQGRGGGRPLSPGCPTPLPAGSHYPPELFNPHGFEEADGFESIAAAQQAAEDARTAAASTRTAVGFVSSGLQQVALFPPGTVPGLERLLQVGAAPQAPAQAAGAAGARQKEPEAPAPLPGAGAPAAAGGVGTAIMEARHKVAAAVASAAASLGRAGEDGGGARKSRWD